MPAHGHARATSSFHERRFIAQDEGRLHEDDHRRSDGLRTQYVNPNQLSSRS